MSISGGVFIPVVVEGAWHFKSLALGSINAITPYILDSVTAMLATHDRDNPSLQRLTTGDVTVGPTANVMVMAIIYVT